MNLVLIRTEVASWEPHWPKGACTRVLFASHTILPSSSVWNGTMTSSVQFLLKMQRIFCIFLHGVPSAGPRGGQDLSAFQPAPLCRPQGARSLTATGRTGRQRLLFLVRRAGHPLRAGPVSQPTPPHKTRRLLLQGTPGRPENLQWFAWLGERLG